uniref:Histone H2A/H2B/H3 domain-containing protein n=1 Tax=Ditylenchus dipsaci TaxID=166011 RepID=A0A915EK77_9BILA
MPQVKDQRERFWIKVKDTMPQILSAEERLEGGTQIDFLVLLQGSPVLAQVVAEDLSLMTLSHFSAILQYPVLYIGCNQIPEAGGGGLSVVDHSNLIGSGFIIALCGWALLFLYYNTCGRPVVVKQTEDNKFTGDVTKKLEANANVVDDGLWTTVIPRPHSPVMGQHEKEMESTRLELSPLPVLTPSISPELDWGKEAPDEPNPTFSQVIQPQKNVRISTPKQQIPAAVHFKEKAKELEPNSRTVNSSSEEIAKTKQLQMPKEDVLLPTKRWTPYLAGDQVAAILAVSPQFQDYPIPITTDSGVLQLHAKQICAPPTP